MINANEAVLGNYKVVSLIYSTLGIWPGKQKCLGYLFYGSNKDNVLHFKVGLITLTIWCNVFAYIYS